MRLSRTVQSFFCFVLVFSACAKDPQPDLEAGADAAAPVVGTPLATPEKKPMAPSAVSDGAIVTTPSVDQRNAPDDAAKMVGVDAAVAAGDGAPGLPSPPRDAQSVDLIPLPIVTCASGTADVCLDFETGKLPTAWRRASGAPIVETGQVARGQYALHLPALVPKKSHSISTSQLGTITNVMYGRFRLFMMPGAPNGHGAMVRGVDQAGNWYELGFQFSSFHGNWHPPTGVPERWMDSKFKIPGGKWSCVEFLFDGATPAVTKIWSDGSDVTYYQSAKTPGPLVVEKFKQVEIGFIPYHGTSIKDYEGDLAPALTDMWIDDIVLDSKRIGCE